MRSQVERRRPGPGSEPSDGVNIEMVTVRMGKQQIGNGRWVNAEMSHRIGNGGATIDQNSIVKYNG